ncbi:MAG: hypothetical protein ACJ763_08715 [Bdellovibrionia bacterium]
MTKNRTLLFLAILAAGSSYAHPKQKANPKLLQELRLMARDSYADAKNLAGEADANRKPLVCLLAEGPVLAAEAFTTAVVAGAKGMAAAIKGSSNPNSLSPPVDLINKSDAQKAQRELAPIVAQINASHKEGELITLEKIKKNLALLKAEKDKVLATEVSDSFNDSVKEQLTCKSLSRKRTAKLAQIAVTEFDYLSTVYRALNGGFTPRLSADPYERDQNYEGILSDLHFMNYDDLDSPVADIRQSNRMTASTRSQEGSAGSAQETSSKAASKASVAQ